MAESSILSIALKNYKNIQTDGEITLGNLNILIGPNASGKSNLINLLEFLKDVLIESTDPNLGITSFDKAILRLGSEHILDQSFKPPATVNLAFEFPGQAIGKNRLLEIDLRIQGQNRKVIIEKESLSQLQGKEQPFFYYKFHDQQSGAGEVSVYKESGAKETGYHKLDSVPTDELALVALPRLLERSNLSPELTPIYQVRRKILETVSTWRFYNANDMNLQAIRGAEPRIGPGDIFIDPSGENLALVMENLSQAHLEFEEVINQAMTEILPFTHRVRATRSGRLSLIAEWYFDRPNGKREQFYLSDMSDGSVRMLCWACILLSPQLPNLLIIEEPEIGIHVAWLPILAKWIKTAAHQTQVIISTHSPDLLDHFTEQMENVLVFKLSEENPGRFCVQRIQDQAIREQLKNGWELGDLYRTGDPGVGGWPW